MAQITINIGTVANDGTGDTLRGAFANTNNNFTELYSHNTNVSTNIVSVAVGSNAWTNVVSVAGNSYAIQIGAASNTWANNINTFAYGVNQNTVASFSKANDAYNLANAAFTYANTINDTSNNTVTFNHANAAFDKANSANVLAYNTGIGANLYTDVVGLAGNNYTNTSVNVAFNKANTAWEYANTVNTYVTLTGPFADDAEASNNGVSMMGLYYTAQGNVKIRLV